jgi:hypothetical protein
VQCVDCLLYLRGRNPVVDQVFLGHCISDRTVYEGGVLIAESDDRPKKQDVCTCLAAALVILSPFRRLKMPDRSVIIILRLSCCMYLSSSFKACLNLRYVLIFLSRE